MTSKHQKKQLLFTVKESRDKQICYYYDNYRMYVFVGDKLANELEWKWEESRMWFRHLNSDNWVKDSDPVNEAYCEYITNKIMLED